MPDPIQAQPTELIHFEYQHTDEQGNPLLDPRTGKQIITNLTGKDWKEIAEKERDAHIHVTRALHRARTQKPVPLSSQQKPAELSAEEERQAAADLQDPTKARAAVRKLTGLEDLEAKQKALDESQYKADAQRAAYQFMVAHIADYYPCAANAALMRSYIDAEGLDPRIVDNYEVAFNAVFDRLAPRPAPVAAPALAKEGPAVPAPRQSSGGVQPGQLSGQRPRIRKANEITKESVNEMLRTKEGRAEFNKRTRIDPEFVRQVNALGIHPRGNFF